MCSGRILRFERTQSRLTSLDARFIIKGMGRKKLTRTKNRNTYSLENLKQLREIRDKISPLGMHMTDSQALDVAVSTVHRVMFDNKLSVVDLDKVLAYFNEHLKRTWADFVSKALEGAGHEGVVVDWHKDGSVEVRWDEGRAIVPAQVFEGKGMREDDMLRDMKTSELPI